MNAAHGLFVNVREHCFKAHQRKNLDYSDIFATLRHHSVSVTTSKW